jgi:DEAD/DEAH box helicase domain-containing protein
LSTCGGRGLLLPDVGFELADARGAVTGYAELAWPDRKVALLLPEQSEFARVFGRGGWTVFSLGEEDALIRTLTDTRER